MLFVTHLTPQTPGHGDSGPETRQECAPLCPLTYDEAWWWPPASPPPRQHLCISLSVTAQAGNNTTCSVLALGLLAGYWPETSCAASTLMLPSAEGVWGQA